MNIKNNKRRKNSVSKIEKAFLELLQDHSLSEIRVSQICALAQINRSTFYANYIDIYDLADKIRTNLKTATDNLFKIETSLKYDYDTFLKFFYHIKDNQLLYRTYFKLGYDTNVTIMFHDVDYNQNFFDSKHLEYHIEFFRNGLNAIIKKWLQTHCQESPEEMLEIVFSEYQRKPLSIDTK